MSTSGIDIRQTTDRILFRVSLKDADGDKVTAGTTELRIYRLEDDGTLDVYDWTADAFVAVGSGTPDDETTMTHRQRRDSSGADVDTGIWTAVLSALTAFAAGQVYITQITNTAAVPESQEREFQFGGVQGETFKAVLTGFNPQDPTDKTQAGGMLRAAAALAGNNVQTKDHSEANPKWVTRNEDDSADLIVQTRSTAGDVIETVTPS